VIKLQIMNANWTCFMFNDLALGDAKGDLVTERLQLVELQLVVFVAQFVWLASEPTFREHLERVIPGTVPIATDGGVAHVADKLFRMAERFVV
jgi:uncharacterized membrane-anchored protein